MANRYTDAVFHAHIPAVDKAVLWAVAHRTDNQTGACHPSILTISKEAGASKTIVKQVIAYCVEIGILVQAVRKNGKAFLANEYTFNLSGLRWLERADSRYGPDGETDTGLRANVGKLPAQGGSQPTGGLVSGPGVYRRPAQGWGGSQPKNSEVDLRIGTHHSNSEETAPDQTQEQQASPETTQGDPVNPYPCGQPELEAMMATAPQLLHDKSCPCYPRLTDTLCLCGLYDILLDDLQGAYDCLCADPQTDTNGDSLEMYGASCTRCGGFVIRPKVFQIED